MEFSANYSSNGKQYLVIAEKVNIYHNLYKGCDKVLLLVKLSKKGTPLQTVYTSACSNDGKTKYIPQSYPFATFDELKNQAASGQTSDYKWII